MNLSRHHAFAFDDRTAEIYGRIRYALETQGQVIGPIDLLITGPRACQWRM